LAALPVKEIIKNKENDGSMGAGEFDSDEACSPENVVVKPAPGEKELEK
jgi:hypothetical protein